MRPSPQNTAQRPVRRRLTRSALATAVVAGTALMTIPPSGAGAALAAPLNSCVVRDNGDPDLQTLTLTPGTVNVTAASRTVTLTLGAVDTGGPGSASGIRSGYVSLVSPGFARSSFATLRKNAAGKWVGVVTIPRWTHPGAWDVSFVSLSDGAGNSAFWTTDDLQTLGLPTRVNVTAVPDDTAPRLNSFTFTPGSVDTRRAARNVTITAKVSDTQSGVGVVYLNASEPSTGHRSFASLRKVAGAASTYRGTMTIPKWQTNGNWRIDSVQVGDKVGNYRGYTYAQLGAAGFKRNLKVVSGTDASTPRLASFARTPASVDVRTANKSVSATVRAKDTGSGVAFVLVGFTGPGGFTTSASLRRTSGTAKDGIWKGSAAVRRCLSSPGTWKAQVVIYDVAGNFRTFNVGRLTVRAGDHVAPSVSGPSSVAPTDNLTLQFNENVNGINADSATLRKDGFPTPGPVLPGTWTCRTGAGAATSCATGQVRQATFDPSADLESFSSYSVELNPEHQLAVTDLAGNPFRRETISLSVSG